MIYGYARCSTNEEKQNIDRQISELKTLGADIVFFEYISGVKVDKVEFKKLINTINKGDTLITTEVSRISRSTKDLCNIIDQAKEKQIKLVVGSFVVDFTKNELDPMTEGMLKMMGVFAEMERNIITTRVKSGLSHSKSKGIKLGRNKSTINDVPTVLLKYLPRYKNKEITLVELSKLCGLSKNTIYKYINLIENDLTQPK